LGFFVGQLRLLCVYDIKQERSLYLRWLLEMPLIQHQSFRESGILVIGVDQKPARVFGRQFGIFLDHRRKRIQVHRLL